MSAQPDIRPGNASDAAAIARMLSQLANELGDDLRFVTSEETIKRHGFGIVPLFSTLVADDGTSDLVGLSLFLPHFSTTRGKPSVYVQDLWVDPALRGSGLGERLLRATAEQARGEWGAAYLMLTVHGHNEDAVRFYQRIGLQETGGARPMTLEVEQFAELLSQETIAAKVGT